MRKKGGLKANKGNIQNRKWFAKQLNSPVECKIGYPYLSAFKERKRSLLNRSSRKNITSVIMFYLCGF